jgi:hypothetical protein
MKTTTTSVALASKVACELTYRQQQQERLEDDDLKSPTSSLITLTNSTTGVISSPIGDFLVVPITNVCQGRRKQAVFIAA